MDVGYVEMLAIEKCADLTLRMLPVPFDEV